MIGLGWACLERPLGFPSRSLSETGLCFYSERMRFIHFQFILASTVCSLSASLSLSHCVLSLRAWFRTSLCRSCSVTLFPFLLACVRLMYKVPGGVGDPRLLGTLISSVTASSKAWVTASRIVRQ